VLLCRAERAHTGPGIVDRAQRGTLWGSPCARRTMARIDRLNYRDIGVIKAPLCRSPLYEGVEEAFVTRLPASRFSHSPVPDSFHLFLLLAGIPPPPFRGHLPRATATWLC